MTRHLTPADYTEMPWANGKGVTVEMLRIIEDGALTGRVARAAVGESGEGAALERRFQKVLIDEPSREDAISILRGLKEKYESHHKVLIKDAAIIAAVELSTRYISDRFLPDKAIDLIDEAASKLRMEINSKPEELDEVDRRVMQLEIEREAIKREGDQSQLEGLNKEIAELGNKRDALKARWESERGLVEKINEAKDRAEQLKFDAAQAEREGDYEKVAEIRYGRMKETEDQLAKAKADLIELQTTSKMIKEEVDVEEIASVVSRWTGIPVTSMLETERMKLLTLEDELHKRVVGQDQAVRAVAGACAANKLAVGAKELRPVVQHGHRSKADQDQGEIKITHEQGGIKSGFLRFEHVGYGEQAHQDMGQAQRAEHHGHQYGRDLHRIPEQYPGGEDGLSPGVVQRGIAQQ